jgi:hypothetical protein
VLGARETHQSSRRAGREVESLGHVLLEALEAELPVPRRYTSAATEARTRRRAWAG